MGDYLWTRDENSNIPGRLAPLDFREKKIRRIGGQNSYCGGQWDKFKKNFKSSRKGRRKRRVKRFLN